MSNVRGSVYTALRYYQKQGLCEGSEYDDLDAAISVLDDIVEFLRYMAEDSTTDSALMCDDKARWAAGILAELKREEAE